MTTPKKDGGNAFPTRCDGGYDLSGMSLRDWFASQTDIEAYRPVQTFEDKHGRRPTIEELAEYIASIRFAEADAMLLQREK